MTATVARHARPVRGGVLGRQHRGVVSCVAIAGLVGLSACGSDKGSGSESSAADASTGAGPVVKVALDTGFSLTPDPSSISAGTVSFLATNTDGETHEVVVLRTDLAADQLPLDATTGKVVEDAPGVENVGEAEVEAGQTGTVAIALEPGSYVLICNLTDEGGTKVVSHYQQGMRSTLTVT